MSCLKARFFNLVVLSDVLLCSIEDQSWFPFSRRLTRQKDLCFILRNGMKWPWVSEAASRHRPSCDFHLRTAMGPFAPQLGIPVVWSHAAHVRRIIVWEMVFFQAGVQGFTLASCAAKSCSQNLKKLGDFPETLTPTWPYLQRISKDNHGPAIKWLQLGGKKKTLRGSQRCWKVSVQCHDFDLIEYECAISVPIQHWLWFFIRNGTVFLE